MITALELPKSMQTENASQEVLFIFMTMLLVVFVMRTRLFPALPTVLLCAAIPYWAVLIEPYTLPSGFHYQMLTILAFALTIGYLLEYDTRKDFLNQLTIHRLATTDPLCGVLNRRQFFLHAQREMERARRYRHALAVIMMDIDEFKRVNDTFGHATGDQALKLFAQTCANSIRSTDILGRLGGEEFALTLPETDGGAAAQLAERLRSILAQAHIPIHDGQKAQFTVSFGVSVFEPTTDHMFESIIHRADQCLYTAKQQGRNRVVSALGLPALA